jgi:ubiquinone/menaquinone biosynthesis C-methylase UbiE
LDSLKSVLNDPEVARLLEQASALFQAGQPGALALDGVADGIVRCFDVAGVDLQQLSRPATEILKARPLTQELVFLARQGNLHQLRQCMLSHAGAVLFQDELLIKSLICTLFCDPDIEMLLKAARRVLLELAVDTQGSFGKAGIVDDDCSFLAALACQCFMNEYCYVTGPDEVSGLQQLELALQHTMQEAPGTCSLPALLCIYGMYRPLYRLPGGARWLERDDLPDGRVFRSLLETQWYGPREQLEIRKQITAVTGIDDSTSRKVCEMYEESPYPPWLTVSRRVPRPFREQMQRMFPALLLPQPDDDTVQVLVAGCGTGKQAIMSAGRFTRENLLAVDLSLSSLAYAVRKTRQLAIDNITFAQADILRLAELQQRFHLIESVGVLHHMDDPQQALALLAGLLHTNGLMNIGLYSARARRHISLLREYFQQSGLPVTADRIRQARVEILANDNEACRRVRRLADFYSISGCRDLLFHVQERCYRLPEIATLLAGAGLRFLGFGWSDQRVPARYRQEYPNDPLQTDLAKWDAFEQRHPDTFLGMYVFWCQKI